VERTRAAFRVSVGSGTLEQVSLRLPKPSFKQIAIGVGLFAAAAGAFQVWRWTRPRVVSVCVVTDYSFRNRRPDWRDLLNARFEAANRIFRGTGVHWDFRDADQPDPTGKLEGGIEERRQRLIRTECDADVILAVTGQPGLKGGDVPPFAHTAVVADLPFESEARNTLNFVQALLTLFGAPVDHAGSGTVMARPPEGETIPKAVRSLVGRLRHFDFAHGTESLDGAWGNRVYDALVSAYASYSPAAARDAHRTIGISLAADGHYSAAIRHLTEMVRLDSSNPAAHMDLATAYTHNFQSAEAIAEYRAAVKLDAGKAAAHAALAVALANSGLGEDAVDEFREALRLDPKFTAAQAGLAYVMTQQPGRINDAIAAYRVAIEMDPKMLAATEGLERATMLRDRAQADAVEARRKAASAPSDAQVHFELALAEARTGNVDAASRSMRRAVELDSASGLAHEQLALLLYRQGDFAAALQHAQTAARLGYEPPRDVVERLKRRAER
jgi:Flp pilus assembly protein TadD